MSKISGELCKLGDVAQDGVLTFLAPDEVEALCPYLIYQVWNAGEVLMSDGETGDFMGFVMAGKLAVKKETNFPGRFTLVAILDPGAMVGEISAVDLGLRTETVVAMQKTEMLLLSHDSLERLLDEHPPLGIKLLKRIIHVLGLRQKYAYDRLSSLL
ncbi:MAG: cyclic nucleotide-binding domain-containing protein [Desulfobulbaceae bacterium]|nr:cyclic nucleotide-binding domain-containing protein [Desulfobulbaceae bacterium]